MENAVWVIFGIIALFLGIGILLQIMAGSSDDSKIKVNANALGKFAQWCDYVCNSDVETMLAKDIEISSGAIVSAQGKSICIEFKHWRDCSYCNCDVNALHLDLNKREILQMYDTHIFKCNFEKASQGVVSIECKG
jgi:hypothetical protein